MDRAFLHRITDCYSTIKFQGILPNTGVAQVSTAGHEQFRALKIEDPYVHLDTTTTGRAIVRFSKGTSVASIGSVELKTPVGTINFHVLETPTPFLLCLADMDRLGVYFNKSTNQLVNKITSIDTPVVRKCGYPWFFLSRKEAAGMFLTEVELKRLHRRFGHLATDCLHTLLTRVGHDDVNRSVLNGIEKFCHSCQMNNQSPRRFKFTLC